MYPRLAFLHGPRRVEVCHGAGRYHRAPETNSQKAPEKDGKIPKTASRIVFQLWVFKGFSGCSCHEV